MARTLGYLATTVVVCFGLAVGVAGPANAWNPTGCRFGGSSPTIDTRLGSSLGTYGLTSIASASIDRWNSKPIGPQFNVVSSSDYQLSIYAFSDAGADYWGFTNATDLSCWDETLPAANWGSSNTIYVALNNYSITADGLSTGNIRKVFSHELGHALGLGHTGLVKADCTVAPSVMVQGQRKWTCGWGSEPWQDDVNGINAIY